MFDTDYALRLAAAGVVLLIGLSSSIAWLPARGRDPAGIPARLFMTSGIVVAILDFGGVGGVLGLSLALLGGFVAWEGRPAPEVPRPPRRGAVIAAVVTGLATLAMFQGWSPLERIPSQVRAVATVVIAATGVLATLAVADRARVSQRDAVRRRFDTS